MALISCPECGNQCSDQAEACPKCGYPFKRETTTNPAPTKPVQYETQVVKIRVWGRSASKLDEKLKPYYILGWEVVTMVEDPWLGGMASPVYKVTMRRPKKNK